MTKVIEVTSEWNNYAEFTSDAVDWVGYNANTKEAFVEWCDVSNVYAYPNVPKDVVETAVNSFSVGSAIASLKQQYGPGNNLGAEWDIEVETVAEVVPFVVANDGAPTKEFSLAEVPVKSGNAGLSVSSDTYTYELFFDLAGVERSHTITGKSTLEQALDSLNDAAGALGVPIVVKKAVINFV